MHLFLICHLCQLFCALVKMPQSDVLSCLKVFNPIQPDQAALKINGFTLLKFSKGKKQFKNFDKNEFM